MALRRDARTVSYEEASDRARREHLRYAGQKFEEGTGGNAQVLALANNSPTRWALAQGYDAVTVHQEDGSDEVVVLNRGALIVSSEFEAAGENVTRRMRSAA
jgi:hypothetical protein